MTEDRLLVLVTGLPGSGKTTLARELAPALGLPLFSKDTVKEALFDTLGVADRDWSLRIGTAANEVVWSLAAESSLGAVVEAWVPPERDRELVARGVRRAGFARVLEVFCTCAADIAVRRYGTRARHPGHRAGEGDALSRIRVLAPTLAPLALGPALRVDTSQPVDVAHVLAWLHHHHSHQHGLHPADDPAHHPADHPVRGDSDDDTPSGVRLTPRT